MKPQYLLPFFLLLGLYNDEATAQGLVSDSVSAPHYRHAAHRNFFWLVPSNTDQINGLAFGLWATPMKQQRQQINGLAITLPLPVVPYMLVQGFAPLGLPLLRYQSETDSTPKKNKISHLTARVYSGELSVADEEINGVHLTISEIGNTCVHGLSLSGLTIYCSGVDGVGISGLANFTDHFRGVMIAPVGNSSRRGSGVQIGLFNSCINCSGLQIGLINQNGKRITPFVNYRSRRRAARLAQADTTNQHSGTWQPAPSHPATPQK
ncbi:MAG: hypothetical protein EBZ77_10380 [Chitinophagia bacterium]|nr:hypothetical protein [Chitinophagia bacterium]